MDLIKKTIIVSLLMAVYCIHQIKAQSQTTQAVSNLNLTTVLPPAPNAFEMTRYSGLPVSLSSGSVSATIPLGEVRAGKISVPINLAYNSGNGVLVNQIASRTGTGWILNAGGVITRTVYNNPDESSQWVVPPPGMDGETQAVYDYLSTATSSLSGFDTQVDIFSFNFNGYNGQFYLDPNDKTKVVMLSASGLKVVTNFHSEQTGDWTLMVIDPKGTKYYFGGTGATETSKTNPQGLSSDCGKNFLLPIPNAWYLKSIQHYTGETISFVYTACNFSYFSDISQTIFANQGITQQVCNPLQDCPAAPASTVCLSDLVTSGVVLQRIIAPFETVEFTYTTRQDIPGDYLLAGVNFYKKGVADNTQLTLFDTYSLNYTVANNTTYHNAYANSSMLSYRPFLTSVVRSASGMQAQTHSMSYYNINGLPSRLSYAQDYWGYFNGVNNENLVPPSSEPATTLLFPSNLANREPNGSYSYYGLLSQITYPTKGTDVLQYEPNTVYETRTALLPAIIVTRTQTGTGTNGEADDTYAFNLINSQNVSLAMSCTYSGTGTNDGLHQHLIATVYDPSGYQVYTEQIAVGSTSNKILTIGPGNYTLKLQVYGAAAVGSVDLRYQPSNGPITANYQVGGVRVAKNISSPLTGNTLVKKYIYAALTAQSNSTGILRAKAKASDYYSTFRTGVSCAGNGLGNDVGICGYQVAYSAPIHQLTYFSGGHIYYSNVIELQDSLWTNGGVEHQYVYASPGQDAVVIRTNAIPGAPITNFDFPTGLEQLRQTFTSTGLTGGSYQYTIVNKVATHYVIDSRLTRYQDNYVIRKNWQPTIVDPAGSSTFDAFDLATYQVESKWIYPDIVTTTSYDLAGLNPVTTTQTDVYNNTNNFEVSERQTTGSDAIAEKTTYSYPDDMVAAGTTSPYQAMVDDNVIDPVIEQSFYKNNVFQQAIKTNYTDFGNHVYEPGSIQTKTTGAYDTRINFNGYTTSGGLLSQAKTYGPASSYLWGYQNLLPIAEVKNAAANEIYTQNFEFTTGGTISTVQSHTGKQSNLGAYTVSFTPPAGKSYVISWFQLNGSVWEYHREAYAGTKAFTGSIYIDDIAVYPADAQMSMFTYDPVLGLTSGTDPKGQSSFYEYDNYQRLMNIKDKDGNITKRIDYHYQQ